MRRSLSEAAPLLTVTDLAEYLKVHPSTVYRLVRTGQLPAFKVGGNWRFNLEQVESWCRARNGKPKT